MSPVPRFPLSRRNNEVFLFRPDACLELLLLLGCGFRGFFLNGLPTFFLGSPSLIDVFDKGTTWTVSSLPHESRRCIN
jgi:hypothetical protein